MRQLASELKCSPMTPYRYFKDKDEILAVVCAGAFDRLSKSLELALGRAEKMPTARAYAVSKAYMDFAGKEPHAFRLMFAPTPAIEDARSTLAEATSRTRDLMLRLFCDLAPKRSDAAQKLVFSQAYWAALHGVVMLQLSNALSSPMDKDAVLNVLIPQLFETLKVA